MDIRAQLADLHGRSQAILDGCAADPAHRDLTEAERTELDRLSGEFDQLRARLDVEDRGQEVATLRGTGRKSLPDELAGGGGGNGPGRHGCWGTRPTTGMFSGMFGGPRSMAGFRDAQEFMSAALSGNYDPRLHQVNAAGPGSRTDLGESGGWMMPLPVSDALIDIAFSTSSILSLVTRVPMTSKYETYPRFKFEDRSTGLMGGFAGRWTGEGMDDVLEQASIEALNVTANKHTIFTKATVELIQDSPMFVQRFQPMMERAVQYALEKAVVNGTGAGQPLGLRNDVALLTITAEGGQVADTINFINLSKMYAAMYPGGVSKAVWLCHPSCIPQLVTMPFQVRNVAGTEVVGGSAAATVSGDGGLTLLGRPVIQNEHLPRIGDLGDIMFVDLSQFGLFLRRELYIEVSNAVYWISSEIAYKATFRGTGMGLWTSASKRPGDAVPAESFVVTLAAR